MSDLISRQAAIKALCEKGMCGDKQCNAYPCEDVRAIEQVPTIDPVKRGKWIYDKGLYRCTACNNLLTVAGWDIPEEQIYKAFKFCPNCGARMER